MAIVCYSVNLHFIGCTRRITLLKGLEFKGIIFDSLAIQQSVHREH
uniref:Uncharacterized protein n=1 Tax=Anguilla anguilla TaxID=7936 RepID=A0A0E9VDK1_ANGAN